MSPFEIRLLGPPTVRMGRQSLTFGARASSLIAFLAVEGATSRERILGYFWPESTQKKAQGSLRYLLHSIRKTAENLVQASARSLELSNLVTTDVEQLLQADTPSQRSAVSHLAQGEFCEGLFAGSTEFEEWLEKQRSRWREQMVDNLLKLSVELMPRDGLKPARQAVLLDPASEAAHANLIGLLVSLGEIAEAHRQWERCKESLWEELAVEPSASTRDLLTQAPMNKLVNNLPVCSVALIGRTDCRDSLENKLSQSRLVTITGEGGIGKTTLALDVARSKAKEINVWLMELADLRPQQDLSNELSDICGVPPGMSITEHLCDVECVVVLDNCEHLRETAARLAANLLESCQKLKILATSREPLRIDGEQVVPLDPLELSSSIKLFVERAHQIGANPAEQGTELEELCRRLDGLPLAIELAAARTRTLSLPHLIQGLENRFRLLKNKKTTAQDRQQTLGTLIQWSYDRLAQGEQQGYRRLSIFRSGFYVESAAAVLDQDSWDIADLLESLIDKSLLRSRPDGGGLRYYFLESLREFGWDRLKAEDELDTLCVSHLNHFLSMARSLCPLTRGEQQRVWLDKLDSELENFRAALQFALDDEPVMALELAAALCPLWKDRDHRQEGREFLDHALQRNKSCQPEWPRALLLRGELEIQQDECEKALVTLEECLQLGHDRKQDEIVARAAKGLGTANFFLENLDASSVHYERALSVYQNIADKHEIANCINNLGMVELWAKNFARAEALFHQSIELHKDEKDCRGQGVALGNLGYVAIGREDLGLAVECFEEALRLLNSVGALWNSAYFLEGLGRAFCALQKWQKAVRCLAVADELRSRLNTPRLPFERASYEELIDHLKFSDPDFHQTWQEAIGLKTEELFTETDS